jgi:hypothetical protein
MAGLIQTAEIQNQKTIKKTIYLEHIVIAVFKASTFFVMRNMS